MKFKIFGEQENKPTNTMFIEILGKQTIIKLVEQKIAENFKEITEDIKRLKDENLQLHEDIEILRKEIKNSKWKN